MRDPFEKAWDEMTAEEREAERKEKMWASGGEECDECGRQEYEQDLNKYGDRFYCEDCYRDVLETGAQLLIDATRQIMSPYEGAPLPLNIALAVGTLDAALEEIRHEQDEQQFLPWSKD